MSARRVVVLSLVTALEPLVAQIAKLTREIALPLRSGSPPWYEPPLWRSPS